MAVILEFTVPVDQIAFTELFEAVPDLNLEFEERITGTNPSNATLVWVTGRVDTDRLSAGFDSCPTVTAARALLERDSAVLYEIEMDLDGGLWEVFTTNPGYILDVRGSADGWYFRTLFPDEADIAPFMQACRDRDITVTPLRIDTSPTPSIEKTLSKRQYDALEIALSRGYWDVPRETSLQSIADDLQISDQAASERLRRGIRTLVSDRIDGDHTEM